ncbi:phosphoribosyltransferase [Halomonas campisalis]|uniref:Phosphoribosyltransferase n=1 Tax=Billgrantia campisalis TaxID=74661 RepID=A0ABS9PDI0_9GAMM|nr:phosphoribosyltransferase family protein [Halomonas campisalis]MCG6659160.1 phosphoribosyltransferase [Halomonas campisalis]MDR5863805.1 phosphoribosyltransferase family protein [Halomonas campisalis]
MFRDRLDAAEQLARRLDRLKGHQPLILAIPRGGVPMAHRLAEALDGELDVVLVRKIGAPGSPEFAIGAVSEEGEVLLDDDVASHFSPVAVEREIARQQRLIDERRQRYTPVRPPIPPEGRVVVVVDDGSATGATMEAALRALHGRPERLIAALGVASPSAVKRLEAWADEVVCLQVPEGFMAVGQFFADFSEVDDDEVMALLVSAAEGRRAAPDDSTSS